MSSEEAGTVSSRQAFGVMITSVAFLGTVLNGVAVWFFFHLARNSKKLNDALICSVSVSDLIQSSIVYSLNSLWVFRVITGKRLCKAYGFLTHWMAVTSIAHLTVMAYERYQSTNNGYRRKIYSRCMMIAIISFPWCYALVWAALPLIGWSSYDTEQDSLSCGIKWHSKDTMSVSYTIVVFFFDFLIPLTIIAICYWHMIKLLKKSSKTVRRAMSMNPGSQQMKTDRIVKDEKNLVVIVILLIVAFVLAWAPYALVAGLVIGGVEIKGDYLLAPAYFGKMGVLYNPIIYAFMHTKFRAYFKSNWRMCPKIVISPDLADDLASHSMHASVKETTSKQQQVRSRPNDRYQRDTCSVQKEPT